jgi:signal transduction histidine kinase
MAGKQVPLRLTELIVVAAVFLGALTWAGRAAWMEIRRLRSSTQVERLARLDEAAAERHAAETHASLTRLQRSLMVSFGLLVVAGGIIGTQAYRRMIAPLRSTLSQSRAIMERQEKLASLGVFAAGIAHEIRNPLTAIKVRLFSLKASHAPGTSERDDLEVIEAEIERLERIVREFLCWNSCGPGRCFEPPPSCWTRILPGNPSALRWKSTTMNR